MADAWFSKKKFVDQIISAGMHLISRLRDDADLMYLYKGKPTGNKGRTRKYAGKIDHNNIDENYFSLVKQIEGSTIFCADGIF